MILNTAKDYFENNKERLREQAKNKYRNLSEEEKNKKREYVKTDIIICLKKRHDITIRIPKQLSKKLS